MKEIKTKASTSSETLYTSYKMLCNDPRNKIILTLREGI
jgi:hypothetical protein